MIPTVNALLDAELEIIKQPSINYKMHFDKDDIFINGYRDALDAMKQVIYKILNTERYQYIIYSWNYGIELKDLFGKPVTEVCPILERRITEALVQDDRIDSVDSFYFDISVRNIVHVTFVANTIFGPIATQKEVPY